MDDASRQTALYRGIWAADPAYGTALCDVHDTVAHRIAPHLVRLYPDAPCEVADFGAGDGRFLRQMLRSSLCASGVGIDVHKPRWLPRSIEWRQELLWDAAVTADYVISTDTLEHIPSSRVDDVLQRIAECAPHGFLRIATKEDTYGTTRGLHLHETVEEPEWWLDHCRRAGIQPSSWRVYPGSAVEVWF